MRITKVIFPQFFCSHSRIIQCSKKFYVAGQKLLLINAIISMQWCKLGIKIKGIQFGVSEFHGMDQLSW